MGNKLKKFGLFILALTVSTVTFSLGYKVLDMTALDASIAPVCILTFSICLLCLPSDED